MNGLSLVLAIYLCFKTNYWWSILIPGVISILLWWYSPVFKKRAFIGNLVVALCTACVPVWAAIYDLHELRESYSDMLVDPIIYFERMWSWVFLLSGFAFILTLVREAVKDIEDLEGDIEGNYHTLPIARGVPFTRRYILGLLGLFSALLGFGIFKLYSGGNSLLIIPIIATIIIPLMVCFVSIARAEQKHDFHRSGVHVKVLMLGGLVALVAMSLLRSYDLS
jgi:4-hydroxybenzoate polyprenyltransferase